MFRRIAVLVLAGVLALAPRAAEAQLKVVTSTTDLYDIAKAVGGNKIVAAHIARQFAQVDPKSAALYQANLKTFEATVDAKLGEWQRMLAPSGRTSSRHATFDRIAF